MTIYSRGASMAVQDPDTARTELPSARMIYREDDAHFKQRLDFSIQMSWVYNSVTTVLVFVVIFYLFNQPIYIAIIMGLLVLLVSNLSLTLSNVSRTHRWEVYTNRVVIPSGRGDSSTTLDFHDIEEISRTRGVTGERVVIRLGGNTKMSFPVEGQEKSLTALETAFSQYRTVRGPRTSQVGEAGGQDGPAEAPGP
jgi:hypothetical protein